LVMVLKACVRYKGGMAHYFITREHEGIYHAQLSRFDGRPDRYPPYEVTLIKGRDEWLGSIEETSLLHHLGSIVDKKLHD
jgi:hypothetical protein